MTISLSDAGKRYNRDWIFRHFNYNFESGKSYAITGANGSGKSTMLQAISGAMMVNEGTVQYKSATGTGQRETSKRKSIAEQLTTENIFKHVSVCAPYLELVEEMSLREFLDFHKGFKPFLKTITTDFIISILGLEKAENKQIRFYSSGMKQRVKLAQCIFSNAAIVLLDEPCTNLDAAGIELYHSLITEYCKDRLVVVSSNDEVEYNFCDERVNVGDYKS